MTVPCWTRRRRWSPKCSCAIVIRAGADVFLINHCDNKHFTGFLSAVDKLIKVYERDDTRYKVSGMLDQIGVFLILEQLYRCMVSNPRQGYQRQKEISLTNAIHVFNILLNLMT